MNDVTWKIYNSEQKKYILDTQCYLGEIESLLKQNQSVVIPVVGGSMSPFLIDSRDYVYLKSVDRLKKGDIILYKRNNGEYVLHRIYCIKENMFYTIGDAQMILEGPLLNDQILGVVSNVRRKGRWIGKYHILSLFFQYIWIRCVKYRSLLIRIYRFMERRI